MDPLVIIAPLSVALHVVQQMFGGTGYYDTSGLWWPYEKSQGPRTPLSASATPFTATTLRKGHANEEDIDYKPIPADEAAATPIPRRPKMPPSAYQIFVQNTRPTITGSASEAAKELSKRWLSMEPVQKQTFEKLAQDQKAQYDRDVTEFKKITKCDDPCIQDTCALTQRIGTARLDRKGIGSPIQRIGTARQQLHHRGGVSLPSLTRFTGYHLFVIRICDGLSGSSSEVADQALEFWDALDPEEKAEYEQTAVDMDDVEQEEARKEYDHAVSDFGDGHATQKEEDSE